MKVLVQQLKPGDVLKGTGEIFLESYAGLWTPTGKVVVVLGEPAGVDRGKTRSAEWWKNTKVSIKDRA